MTLMEQQQLHFGENYLTDKLAFIYVTTYCNLRCHHCYVGELLNKPEHMKLDDLFAILRYARTIGYWQMEFLGGEPFMYPYLSAGIKEARRLGFKVFITTNGIVKPNTDLFFDYLSISLDQLSDQENSQRPGLGFQRFVANIPILKKMAEHCSATITLSQRNAADLKGLLDFCELHEFDTVLIHYFTPVGAGAKEPEMMIPPLDYIQITEWIEQNANQYSIPIRYQKKYIRRNNAALTARQLGLQYLGNRSRILGEGLAIFPDMTVHLDPLFFDKEPLGWFDGQGIRFNPSSHELDSLFRVPEMCNGCELAPLCGGPDSVSIAYPEQHNMHAICSADYIPVETTWTVPL